MNVLITRAALQILCIPASHRRKWCVVQLFGDVLNVLTNPALTSSGESLCYIAEDVYTQI